MLLLARHGFDTLLLAGAGSAGGKQHPVHSKEPKSAGGGVIQPIEDYRSALLNAVYDGGREAETFNGLKR